MNTILTWLVRIFYPMCSPEGRQKRIEELMNDTGEIREICAGIVYGRDATRVPFTFTDEEKEEAAKILKLLESHRIRLPSERGKA